MICFVSSPSPGLYENQDTTYLWKRGGLIGANNRTGYEHCLIDFLRRSGGLTVDTMCMYVLSMRFFLRAHGLLGS